MSWLRRLSRDRSSKYEPEYQQPETNYRSDRPPTSYTESRQSAPTKDTQYPTTPEMLRRSQQEQKNHSFAPHGAPPASSDDGTMHTATMAAAPDPLTRAFNEAIKPYHEKMSLLQADLDNANAQIHSLEAEKAALHNWIDKRGLRPDLPSDLSAGLATQSPVAASTLATQLDRKMTMLNFSLHHLADALPTPVPASTVTNTLAALLPKISYLSTLPAGSPFAFEALIKLAGNLNSHHSGEETDVDRASIAEFYTDLDDIMANVVGKRLMGISDGEEDWDVGRDVRRLEKTAAFLKKEMGVRNYFLRSLDVMRGESRDGAGNAEGTTRYSEESR